MGIQIREAKSEEMRKNIRTVKQMTKGMGFDENMGKVNWSFVRTISNFGYQFMPKEKGIKFKKIRLGNVKAIISEYGISQNKNIIMYIHGGGFVSGSAAASKGYSSMLAKYSGCKVIAVGLKVKNMNKVPCILVHSPFVDFTDSLDRSEHEIDDFTVKQGCLKPLRQIYVGENEPDNPFISPIFGDYADFPPTFITCNYNETLYADAKALYNKCEQAGVDVELVEMKGTFHAFAPIGTGTPETKQILEENIAFMQKYI